MKNPSALTISLNSVSQGAYDGSSQKSINITAKNVGADSSGTAETKVSEHNNSEEAHADIRNLITTLATRLTTLADSDDTTLDQLSEIVAYIKNNKSLIDGITTSKVNVSDIIDNLTFSAVNKPLSAKQGKVLKDLITALTNTVDGKVNKAGNTMTGTLTSSKTTVAHIDGNRGVTIINSTAKAGDYTMLDKLNSTNGYFTDGVWQGKRVFFYTAKSIVDENRISYELVLLDESGNSSFPGLISASRGSFKGDIIVTANRSDTLSPTVPASGRIDEGINNVQDLGEYKSFIGSYADIDKIWWNVVSARHGNGWDDGHYLGMYLRSELLDNGDLLWGKQMGSAKGWQDERTLLDSYNYKKFCTPNNIGALSINGGYMASDSYIGFEEENYSDGGFRQKSIVDKSGIYIESVDYEEDDTENLHEYNNISTNISAEGIEIANHSQNQYLNIDYNTIQSDKSIFVSPQQTARPFEFAYTYFARNGDDGKTSLGTSSMRWKELYASNGTIQTSDRTKKDNINSLEIKKTQAFINGLNPVSYKMLDGTSGRTHYGFIAQDVEELIIQLGMNSKDFAGFIKSPKKIIKYEDENGKKLENPIEEVLKGEYDYALRYDEFIAPLTKVVQEQQKTIEKQQRMIEQQQIAIENQQKEIEQIKKDISKIYSSM